MAGSASASSWLGTATRTIWHPDAVSSAICCKVALISAVTVVVIDCTLTGASPPTYTGCVSCRSRIWRDLRRGATTGGGAEGIPRPILTPSLWLADLRRASRQPDRPLALRYGWGI